MITTQKIEDLVKEELKMAQEINGEKFNSPHEAFGVIREEYDEAEAELDNVLKSLLRYWEAVKKDDFAVQRTSLVNMYNSSLLLIAESVQVAAMCIKGLK